MNIHWNNGLPFIAIELTTTQNSLKLHNVLIDTGAASSLFNVDKIFEQGLTIEASDSICKMVGIGGTEFVIQRKVESILIADKTINHPIVQFGEMDYGFEIDGIIGADILKTMSAIIDFNNDTLSSQN